MDCRGRVRISTEQRRLLLAEFERSGLSVVQFAKRTGLKYSTFAAWIQRYGRKRRPALKSAVRLLEAVVAPKGTACLQVQLPGGAKMELHELGQVALAVALVRALEKSC
jgi:transposase-like protein